MAMVDAMPKPRLGIQCLCMRAGLHAWSTCCLQPSLPGGQGRAGRHLRPVLPHLLWPLLPEGQIVGPRAQQVVVKSSVAALLLRHHAIMPCHASRKPRKRQGLWHRCVVVHQSARGLSCYSYLYARLAFGWLHAECRAANTGLPLPRAPKGCTACAHAP